MRKTANKTYSDNINRFDPEGDPHFEYLYEDSAFLSNDDGSGYISFEIFEVESSENNNFVVFLSTSFSNDLTSYPKEIHLISCASNEIENILLDLKTNFISKHNLKEQDISISEFFSI